MYITFGKMLYNKRKEKELSALDLARLLGKSKSYISQIECGYRTAPSENVLKDMADTLELKGNERDDFFDLAALSRGTIASDLADYINSTPNAREAIRLAKRNKIRGNQWSDFEKTITKNKNNKKK